MNSNDIGDTLGKGGNRRSKWDQIPADYYASSSSSEQPAKEEETEPVKASAPDLCSISEKALAFISSKMKSSSTPSTTADEAKCPPAPKAPESQLDANFSFSDILYINSCRPEVRYLLTQQSTFEQVKGETGAVIVSRGCVTNVINPDSMAASNYENIEDMPLHLFIQADSQEKVDKAYDYIRYLIDRPSTTPSGLLMSKIFIDYAPTVDPAFTLNAKLIGPKGSYVKHIQTVTGCKVRLRGRDSDYVEGSSRLESSDLLHLFITGPTEDKVLQAKALAENLVSNVKAKYNHWLEERKNVQMKEMASSSPTMHESITHSAPLPLTERQPPPPPYSERQQPPPPSSNPTSVSPSSCNFTSPSSSPSVASSSSSNANRPPYSSSVHGGAPSPAHYEQYSLAGDEDATNSSKELSDATKQQQHPNNYYNARRNMHQMPNFPNAYIPSVYPYHPQCPPYMYLPAYYSYYGYPVTLPPQAAAAPSPVPGDPKAAAAHPRGSPCPSTYEQLGHVQGPGAYPPTQNLPPESVSVRKPFSEESDDVPTDIDQDIRSVRGTRPPPDPLSDDAHDSIKHAKTTETSVYPAP